MSDIHEIISNSVFIGFIGGFFTAWKFLPWVGRKMNQWKKK